MQRLTKSAVGRPISAVILCFICGIVLQRSPLVGAEEEKMTLRRQFHSLEKEFGTKNKEKAEILSGPTPVLMLNDKSPGRVWKVSLGDFAFKVTIQDKADICIEDVLKRVEKVPPPYRRIFEIVSEGEKAGAAYYVDLSGAAAHGSQDYLNMAPGADAFVIVHEAGHILEQRTTSSKPETLGKWKEAIDEDNVSVSAYGDQVAHEDLAEFAYIYALCLDAGKVQLEELKKLSPRRFQQWEEILRVSGALPDTAPRRDEASSPNLLPADAASTEDFNLVCEQLMSTDNSLVIRLKIDVPPFKDASMTRLVFAYGLTGPKEISTDISNGISTGGTENRHAEVLLVAQIAGGRDTHPPMLMLSTQQSADGKPGAYTFQAHRLEKDTKMPAAFQIDVKAGNYPLDQQIRIGTLGIDPVFFSVESQGKDKQQPGVSGSGDK